MIISKIELTEPAYMRRGHNVRCQRKVKGGPPNRQGTCDRFATYKMDDDYYCNQHAGQVALDHLINDKKRRVLVNNKASVTVQNDNGTSTKLILLADTEPAKLTVKS